MGAFCAALAQAKQFIDVLNAGSKEYVPVLLPFVLASQVIEDQLNYVTAQILFDSAEE